MSLWILVIHKPLIVKFYKSKYHSASLTATKPLECFEPFSIDKQMFWCVLIIKNINFLFFSCQFYGCEGTSLRKVTNLKLEPHARLPLLQTLFHGDQRG